MLLRRLHKANEETIWTFRYCKFKPMDHGNGLIKLITFENKVSALFRIKLRSTSPGLEISLDRTEI